MGAHPDLLLPDRSRAVHLTPRTLIRVESSPLKHARPLPRSLARSNSPRQPPALDRSADVQRLPTVGMLERVPHCLPHLNGNNVRHG